MSLTIERWGWGTGDGKAIIFWGWIDLRLKGESLQKVLTYGMKATIAREEFSPLVAGPSRSRKISMPFAGAAARVGLGGKNKKIISAEDVKRAGVQKNIFKVTKDRVVPAGYLERTQVKTWKEKVMARTVKKEENNSKVVKK